MVSGRLEVGVFPKVGAVFKDLAVDGDVLVWDGRVLGVCLSGEVACGDEISDVVR